MFRRPLEETFDLVCVIIEKRRIIGEYLQSGSAVIPCLIAGSVNAYNLWTEHWEHWSHMPSLEERTEYPYQNIRSKNFPWGDGDKVCCCVCYFTDYILIFLLLDPFVSQLSTRESDRPILIISSWNSDVNYHNPDKTT